MSDEKRSGRPRRGSIDWAAIRDAFEKGETNVSALAKKFGVKRDSIAAHRDKEKWATSGQLVGIAHSNVIDITTKRVLDKIEPETVEKFALGLEKHASISLGLMTAADDLLEAFLADKDTELASTREGTGRDVIVREGRAEVFQKLVTGIKAAVAVSREIAGQRPGQPSIGENTDDNVRLVDWEVIPLPQAESA